MTKRSLLRASVVLPVECCSLTAPILPSPQCFCRVDMSKNVEPPQAEAAQVTSVRLSVWVQEPTLWFQMITLHQWLSTWGPPQTQVFKRLLRGKEGVVNLKVSAHISVCYVMFKSCTAANTTKKFQASKVKSCKQWWNNLYLRVLPWFSDISVQHLHSCLLQPAR